MTSFSTPFQTRIVHFQPASEICLLPFAVGSATQHRPSAVVESDNSQDAASILFGKHHMIAVVTDGCSGTHDKLRATCHSSNEVGSRLMAYLVSNFALKLATTNPSLTGEAFLMKLNDKVRKSLNVMLRTFCGSDRLRREMFINDFLMTTVLGCVVSESRFLVFHSGDGVIAVNGDIKDLENNAGQYLANDLIARSDPTEPLPPPLVSSLKLCHSGMTCELVSIFLATDGLSRFARLHPNLLKDFVATEPPPNQVENGLDFLLQEFRQKVACNSNVNLRLDDDATFVLLRRTGTEYY